jgi:nitroreductase/dihydropteridine reductase
MNVLEAALKRHTTKAFDPARKIPVEVFEQFTTLLRHSPSSVNSQPWHFFIAGDEAGKERVSKATPDAFAYNAGKIRNASHVIVFCARTDLSASYLESVLEQEDKDGRFATPEALNGQKNSRNFYVDLHRNMLEDAPQWAEKQVYLALGTALLAAPMLGLDATPMEGFDSAALDVELGLAEKGLHSVVLLALGYSGSDDFNAKLPKSRLPEASVMTTL